MRQEHVRIDKQHAKHDRQQNQARNHCGANEWAQKSRSRVIGTAPQNYGLQDPQSNTERQINRGNEQILCVDEQPDDGVDHRDADAVEPERTG